MLSIARAADAELDLPYLRGRSVGHGPRSRVELIHAAPDSPSPPDSRKPIVTTFEFWEALTGALIPSCVVQLFVCGDRLPFWQRFTNRFQQPSRGLIVLLLAVGGWLVVGLLGYLAFAVFSLFWPGG